MEELPFSTLTAVSPLDGRYRDKIKELVNYVSEYSLIKTRIEIEAKYLIALSENGVLRKLNGQEKKELEKLSNLSFEEAKRVKKLEEETRHDVKAMERTFREKLKGTSLEDLTEMIHIGLTSEDINNIAYRLMLKRATNEVIIPKLKELLDNLSERALLYCDIPMLARTHGQAAVPTTVGKEISVFAFRVYKQIKELENFKLNGKLNGAVGNFNALNLAYPTVNWISFSQEFIDSFNFTPNLFTTQINPYDDVISYFQIYQRINGIIIDLNQDMWRYISDNWFFQEAKKGEVGSSTMPQKVNPIDFENSEGNLGMANSIIEFFVRKLPISRLQRDLSDSTTIRNIATILGFSLIGYKSVLNGLSRISPNIEKIRHDLTKDYSILGEGVQTILRREGIEDPYSLIASLTRGQHLEKDQWQKWVNDLPINEESKLALEKLNPIGYIGIAVELTKKAIEEIRSSK